jgi:hypothetical protein
MCTSVADVERQIAEAIVANRGVSAQEIVESVLEHACDGLPPRELIERRVRAFLRKAAARDERQLDLFGPDAA